MPEVREILLDISATSADAQRELAKVSAAVAAFDAQEGEATLKVNTFKAAQEIGAMEARLTALDLTEAEPEVKLAVAKARAKLRLFRAELNSMARQTYDVRVDVKRGVLGRIGQLGRGLDAIGDSFKDLTPAADEGGVSFQRFFRVAKGLTPFLAGLVVMIGVTLVSALSALVASLSAAVAGIVAFANSLLAALGPAVALAIGLFLRLTKIIGAKQAQDQAAAVAAGKAGQASEDAAAAMRQEAAAARAVRDAKQALVTAQRNYTAAVREAKQAIVEALAAEKDAARDAAEARRDLQAAREGVKRAKEEAREDIVQAEKNLTQAIRDQQRAAADLAAAHANLGDQTEAAFRAMADAARDVEQAILNVKKAELGILEAQDRVEDTQKKINDLLAEQAEQEGFDPTEVLKKLEDVDLSGFDMAGLLEELGLSDMLEDDADAAERLDDLMRDLEQAKLGVEQASINLTQAELDLNDAQETQNDFVEQGIDAYKPYKNAQEAVKTASENLADATDNVGESQKDLNDLNDLGIKKAPGVVSANETLRNARNRLRDTNENLRLAGEKVEELREQGIKRSPRVISAAEALRDANERLAASYEAQGAAAETSGQRATQSFAAAQRQLDALSDSERKFLRLIRRLGKLFDEVIRPATDKVFEAMIDGFDILAPKVQGAIPMFNALGTVWATQIRSAAKALAGPEWQKAFEVIAVGAVRTADLAGQAFGKLAETLRNLAVAGMPALVNAMEAVNDTFSTWKESTDDTKKWRKAIDGAVESLGLWLQMLGSLTAMWAEFSAVVKPFGDEMVKWLTEIIDKYREWIRSAEGQETIQRFFEDTLPLAKAFGKFLVKWATLLIQFIQFVAPALAVVFEGFSSILDVLNFVFKWLNKIPAPVRAIAGTIAMLLVPLGALRKGVTGIKLVLAALPGIFALIGGIGEQVLEVLGDALDDVKDIAEDIGEAVLSTVVDAITGAPGLVKDAAEWLFKQYKKGVESYLTAYKGIGKWMLGRVTDGFKALSNLVRDAAKWLSKKLKGALGAIKTQFLNRGKDVLRWIWSGVKAAPGAVKSAAQWVSTKIRNALKSITSQFGNRGKDVLRWIWDGLKSTVSGAWSAAKHVAEAVGGALKDFEEYVRGRGKAIFRWIIGGMVDLILAPGKLIVKMVKKLIKAVKDELFSSPNPEFVDMGKSLMDNLISGMSAKNALNFVKKFLGGVAGLGPKLLKSGAIKLGELGWGGVKKVAGGLGDIFGGGGDDRAYNIPGPASLRRWKDSTRFLNDIVKQLVGVAGLGITSGFRRGDSDSYHGVDRARDVGGAVARMLEFAKLMDKAFRKILRELIHTQLGYSVKHMRRVAPYAKASHRDHVHVALARGGIITGPTAALIGEGPHQEAVIPLSGRVMRELAKAMLDEVRSVASNMPTVGLPGLSGVGFPGTSQPTVQHFHIPPAAPAATQPDAKITAVQLAQELRMRGSA